MKHLTTPRLAQAFFVFVVCAAMVTPARSVEYKKKTSSKTRTPVTTEDALWVLTVFQTQSPTVGIKWRKTL